MLRKAYKDTDDVVSLGPYPVNKVAYDAIKVAEKDLRDKGNVVIYSEVFHNAKGEAIAHVYYRRAVYK